MTIQKLLKVPFALLLAVSVVFMGCNSGTNADGDTGSLEVRMHDAPIDSADAVNVSIKQVEINEGSSEDGWSVISSPDKSYNLLELTNGAYEVIGDTTLPTGTYQQIRLVLNETGHNVVVDGQPYDLTIPSGTQTGIKLNVNAEIEPDITYTLLLDFDAARSVVVRGNQQSGEDYLLKPVIKATNEAVTGNIAGTVEPVESEPFVYAIDADEDTLSSTKADTSNGEFKLIGLEEGSYTVSVEPTDESYAIENVNDVEVSVGETTELDTITVSQN